MKILALETSCERGSVALSIDGEMLERALTGSGAGHSATIIPTVRALLAEAGVCVADLDVIAFGAGPGSFTGVRLACGVAQGLALGVDKPVAAVSSLLALAEPCNQALIYCAMDARMNEAYVALYRREGRHLIVMQEPVCMLPDAVPLPPIDGSWCGIGTAFGVHSDVMSQRLSGLIRVEDAEAVPLATAVARLAAQMPASWLDPALAAPEYVRNRVAFTVAERLAQGGKA